MQKKFDNILNNFMNIREKTKDNEQVTLDISKYFTQKHKGFEVG